MKHFQGSSLCYQKEFLLPFTLGLESLFRLVEIGLGLRDGTFGVPVSLQRRQTGLDLTPDHSLLHFLLLLVSVIDLLPWICSLRNALRLTLLSPGVVKQVTRPENYSLNFNNE